MKTLALSLFLAAAVVAAPTARADAIPMPMELSEVQALLIGTWREDSQTMSTGLGHGFTTRTIALGNDTAAMLYFGGISYSNEYTAYAMIGHWTAERVDAKTVKIKLTQSPERGTEWTLVFEDDDHFVFSDSESQNLRPSRFSRVGSKIELNEP